MKVIYRYILRRPSRLYQRLFRAVCSDILRRDEIIYWHYG